MIKKTSYWKFFTILVTLLICFSSENCSGQTESEVLSSIQQGNEKLLDVVKALETASTDNIDVIDLVVQTDGARELLVEALDRYLEADYLSAYDKSLTALNILENIESEIKIRSNNKQRNNKIIYSIIGIFSALITLSIVYFYLTKIYPWYKSKLQDEYGKLEIIYSKEEAK